MREIDPPPPGFTLLELLVVVTLLGILAIIAAPSLVGWLASARTRAALDRLVADVHLARVHAMSTREPTQVVFDWDDRGQCILGYLIREAADSARVLRRVDLSDAAPACLSMNNSRRPLVFNSRGMPHGVMARTFTVTAGPTADTVVLSQLGRVLRKY